MGIKKEEEEEEEEKHKAHKDAVSVCVLNVLAMRVVDELVNVQRH